jgi:Uncharacterized protein conserved in bacteria (DUF2147)
MKERFARTFAIATALTLSFPAMVFAGGNPAGTWRDNEKGSVIKIYECGGGMCAQVLKPYEAKAKDINNPNPALRGRAVVGLTFMNRAKRVAIMFGRARSTMLRTERAIPVR